MRHGHKSGESSNGNDSMFEIILIQSEAPKHADCRGRAHESRNQREALALPKYGLIDEGLAGLTEAS